MLLLAAVASLNQITCDIFEGRVDEWMDGLIVSIWCLVTVNLQGFLTYFVCFWTKNGDIVLIYLAHMLQIIRPRRYRRVYSYEHVIVGGQWVMNEKRGIVIVWTGIELSESRTSFCVKLQLTLCKCILSQQNISSHSLRSGRKLILISRDFNWGLLNYLFSEPGVPSPHITAC